MVGLKTFWTILGFIITNSYLKTLMNCELLLMNKANYNYLVYRKLQCCSSWEKYFKSHEHGHKCMNIYIYIFVYHDQIVDKTCVSDGSVNASHNIVPKYNLIINFRKLWNVQFLKKKIPWDWLMEQLTARGQPVDLSFREREYMQTW